MNTSFARDKIGTGGGLWAYAISKTFPDHVVKPVI